MMTKPILCITISIFTAMAALSVDDEIKLFNGKDLSGWTGDSKLWSVEDGAIVGSTDGLKYNTFLISDDSYSDFELRMKIKLDANNSGVQFRSKFIDDKKFVMSGYQADVANNYWGLLYEERGRGKLDFGKDVSKLARLGEWNDFVIRASGPEITITVNGTQTVSYTEKDEAKGAKSGKIGLQLHAGPAMKVHFKEIVLKKL